MVEVVPDQGNTSLRRYFTLYRVAKAPAAEWQFDPESLGELSQLFEVSPQAMARRLDHLGLRLAADATRSTDDGSTPLYARPKRPMTRSRP